jgi:hypothetical protein
MIASADVRSVASRSRPLALTKSNCAARLYQSRTTFRIARERGVMSSIDRATPSKRINLRNAFRLSGNPMMDKFSIV